MKRSAPSASNNVPSQPPLRLMLHAVDGVFPYLTPNLLKKCFPPDKVSNVLWLGIAVRDTCVLPSGYNVKDKTKPRGYTFSDSVTVDAWMRDYQRVTVPSFDLLQDAVKASSSKSTTVTNQHVMVWTSNGRHPLTPALYYGSAKGLQSHLTVPLHDMIQKKIDEPPSNKQREAAIRRTKEWTNDLLQRQDATESTVWAPLLVDGATIDASQLEFLRETMPTDHVSGIAVIGWPYLDDSKVRQSVCATIRKEWTSHDIAVLSTQSLSQVLDAAIGGCNVIGTNLPTVWAESKKAFLCDIASWKQAISNSKRARVDETEELLDENGCIDLSTNNTANPSQHPWFRDSNPIVMGCQCMTCQIHSRSYIYHLVCAKELLAEILLFVHNLHHMLTMVRELNAAVLEGREQELCNYIQSQLAKKDR